MVKLMATTAWSCYYIGKLAERKFAMSSLKAPQLKVLTFYQFSCLDVSKNSRVKPILITTPNSGQRISRKYELPFKVEHFYGNYHSVIYDISNTSLINGFLNWFKFHCYELCDVSLKIVSVNTLPFTQSMPFLSQLITRWNISFISVHWNSHEIFKCITYVITSVLRSPVTQ